MNATLRHSYGDKDDTGWIDLSDEFGPVVLPAGCTIVASATERNPIGHSADSFTFVCTVEGLSVDNRVIYTLSDTDLLHRAASYDVKVRVTYPGGTPRLTWPNYGAITLIIEA